MAKKKRGQPSTSPQPVAVLQGQPMTVNVTLRVSEDTTPNYYVNNVEVGQTPFDFTITCAKIPTKLRADVLEEVQRSGTLALDATVQITLPPPVIPGLIRALTIQKEMYEKAVGSIPDPVLIPVGTRQ
jgi:hypothetical protein